MRKGKNTGRTMDPDMPVLRPSIPPTPMGPSWRGRRSRGGGWGGLMPTMDEFFGTSTQVCGGFWPFSTDMALPVEGVPIGRSMTTGAGVCCDPISWFRAGIIEQPSMFVMGLPAIGKSTFVRRQVWGMSALGMNAIIPGDLKPDYAELVRLLGGQVIRLGSGLGSINPLDPGGIHEALKRLTGDAREDLLADYHERRSALMEVLLTISRTGREEGRRTVSDVESNVLSTALKILYERTKDDPEPPVIPDLRDLVRQGTPEIRAAAVFDDPENDEAYARSTRDLLSSLHGLANPMGRFGRLFCEQTTERLDLSRPVDFDISTLAQVGDDGRLRIVLGALVQDLERGGQDVGFHVGDGAASLLPSGAADGQQHLHERAAAFVVVGEQVLARVSREPFERFMDAARVERVDGAQAAAQTDDLSAEQPDEFGVVRLQVAGDDRVHAEGGHAPHLAAHERGFADGGQPHDEHAGLFDDAGAEPADRIAAHARAGRHAPSDGHALDGQRHVGAERPESPAHLGAGAEELVHRGHEPAPSAAP